MRTRGSKAAICAALAAGCTASHLPVGPAAAPCCSSLDTSPHAGAIEQLFVPRPGGAAAPEAVSPEVPAAPGADLRPGPTRPRFARGVEVDPALLPILSMQDTDGPAHDVLLEVSEADGFRAAAVRMRGEGAGMLQLRPRSHSSEFGPPRSLRPGATLGCWQGRPQAARWWTVVRGADDVLVVHAAEGVFRGCSLHETRHGTVSARRIEEALFAYRVPWPELPRDPGAASTSRPFEAVVLIGPAVTEALLDGISDSVLGPFSLVAMAVAAERGASASLLVSLVATRRFASALGLPAPPVERTAELALPGVRSGIELLPSADGLHPAVTIFSTPELRVSPPSERPPPVIAGLDDVPPPPSLRRYDGVIDF